MNLSDALTKHQNYVNKLSATERKIVQEELQNIRRQATLEIASGTSGNTLKKNLRSITQGFSDKMIDRMVSLAEKESTAIANIVNRNSKTKVDKIAADKLKNRLLNDNMRLNLGSQEKTRRSLKSVYDQFARKKADEIAQIIRDGQAMKLSPVEIIKNVDERINGLHTRQAKVLTHTSSLYSSSLASEETLKQGFKKLRFTLGDSAEHTDICLSLAGKVFSPEDFPNPPLHWGCNSYPVPVEE